MRKWLLLFCVLVPATLFADGGVVQFQKDAGDLRLTLFSQSSPLRAGPADLSVLLQRADDAEPILHADITLLLVCEKKNAQEEVWRPPCCNMNGGSEEITLKATHDLATNKLLYAAPAILPYPGTWRATVFVRQGDRIVSVSDTLQVLQPSDPWIAYLPFLLLPGFGIGLFALAQKARRDRKKNRKPA